MLFPFPLLMHLPAPLRISEGMSIAQANESKRWQMPLLLQQIKLIMRIGMRMSIRMRLGVRIGIYPSGRPFGLSRKPPLPPISLHEKSSRIALSHATA